MSWFLRGFLLQLWNVLQETVMEVTKKKKSFLEVHSSVTGRNITDGLDVLQLQ